MPRKPSVIGRILGQVEKVVIWLVVVIPFLVGLISGFIVKVIKLWIAAIIEGYKAGNK